MSRTYRKVVSSLALAPFVLFGQADQKSSLRGRFVDDLRAEPAARVAVALTGGSLKEARVVETDAAGNFAFPDLIAGQYTLRAQKAGFFERTFGPYAVTLIAPLDGGDLVLPRMRAISGKVSWQDGDPAPGSVVQLLPFVAGKAAYSEDFSGRRYRVDDRGIFRISNLRPGRYAVVASYGGDDSADPRPRISLPRYYPDADSPSAAAAIDLRTTAEVSDILIALRPTSGVVVEGSVLPSASFPEGREVALRLVIPESPTHGIAAARLRVGQPFRFFDVPEGSYVLVAIATPDPFQTILPVEVGKTRLSHLRVVMPEARPIAGRIEIVEPGAQDAKRSPAAGVRLKAVIPRLPHVGATFGVTESSGAFSLVAAPTETYSLEYRSLPAGTYVASVSQGSRIQAVAPFELMATAEPVQILLKRDGATVKGSIRVERALDSPAFVVLAPTNRAATNRFVTAESTKEGGFAFSAVAPGAYDLFAFDENQENGYLDPAYLEQHVGRKVAITADASGSVIAPPLTLIRVKAQ